MRGNLEFEVLGCDGCFELGVYWFIRYVWIIDYVVVGRWVSYFVDCGMVILVVVWNFDLFIGII